MAGAGVSVGAIYAEAELDITKFQAAAGQLEELAAGIGTSMALAGQGVDAAQLGMDGLAAGLAALGPALEGAASALTAGFEGLGPRLQASAAAAAQAVGQGLAPENFAAAGMGAAQGIATGLTGYDFAGAAGTVSAGILAGLGAGLSGAVAMGGNFSAGLASGILSGRSGVVNAARSVALAAAQAARSALDIHSPSGLTERFGEFFDLGFVRGVRNRLPAVEAAIEDALYVPAPQRAPAVPAVSAAPAQPIDYERLAWAMRQQPAPRLDLDGREVARLNADNIAAAQSVRARDIALNYGTR